MSLQPIVLDTDKTTPIYELPLKIRQGDTGDELQVTLGKSFKKYTDLSTVDVELIAKTPDQRLIKQAVTDKSGNTFKVKFPDEMYTNVGVFRNMYFKIRRFHIKCEVSRVARDRINQRSWKLH